MLLLVGCQRRIETIPYKPILPHPPVIVTNVKKWVEKDPLLLYNHVKTKETVQIVNEYLDFCEYIEILEQAYLL